MKLKLEDTIKELEEKIEKKNIKKGLSEEVLTKIQFFQHERLVHLIVTFFTGVGCILFLLGFIALEILPLLFLFLITLALFIPYIFHYYTLENGTQKLYDLYFKIKDIE
ncbi:MAG: hypothetical protein J6X28_02225 [Bacilli bacterium]|nr:hypothetical protein [Bacilli bacterium]